MHEFLLGALLILAIAWLVVRMRHNKAETRTEFRPVDKAFNAYQAVAIKYSENACDAAKALTGRRFLSREAPRLPLAECDFAECRCKFAQYDDRRSGTDRRSPFAPAGPTAGTGTFERDRRQGTDRRKN